MVVCSTRVSSRDIGVSVKILVAIVSEFAIDIAVANVSILSSLDIIIVVTSTFASIVVNLILPWAVAAVKFVVSLFIRSLMTVVIYLIGYTLVAASIVSSSLI